MTGEKRTETRMRCYNTLCIPYISLHPSLHACIVYYCREGRGVIYREYTKCYSISFLFLFFFHQSSLYPIKIFAKCFYLLVFSVVTNVHNVIVSSGKGQITTLVCINAAGGTAGGTVL